MLVLFTSVSVLVLLTGVFVGVFALIWSILINLLPKLLLTMGPIIEFYEFMSIYAAYIISNISSILGVNVMDGTA